MKVSLRRIGDWGLVVGEGEGGRTSYYLYYACEHDCGS